MRQSSIQFDLDTKQMIADLAKWWGFPPSRNTTAIVRKLVVEAHTREKAKRELEVFDKATREEEDN